MLQSMLARYAIRPDPDGFSVYDLWTSQTVVLALTPQDGLSREDAEQTAAMLSKRADRVFLQ